MTRDECRNQAKECLAAAAQVTDPERKISLLELARRWLRLAFQVEKSGFRGDAVLDPPGDSNH